MGTVYLAEMSEERPDLPAGRMVALKLLRPELVRASRALQRFLREGKLGASIDHPAVVRTYRAECALVGSDLFHFLLLEYVDGGTLADRAPGRLPDPRLRDIARQAAFGLAAIHAAGTVHRDIKPSNLLLATDGSVKISDLSAARLLEGDVRLTLGGEFVGTPRYAAPEQLSGAGAGPAADLYSLGVVLFEAACGRLPFAAGDGAGRTRRARAPWARSVAPDLSPFLDAVIARLLEVEAVDRFASADELLQTVLLAEDSPWWKGQAAEPETPFPVELPPPTLPAPQGPLSTGDAIDTTLGDRYEVLDEIGRGVFGVVLRARDRVATEVVAIKVFSPLRSHSEAQATRFRRELKAARRVTHPGVVRIHDLIELEGRMALTMEFVEGQTLEKHLAREGPLAGEALILLAAELARGLAAAHQAGVVHRDLKPANIILRDSNGRPVITDFGVSRLTANLDPGPIAEGLASADTRLTQDGQVIGTPLYMAPEQLAGRSDVGPPADVYALGVVLFEAATGRSPHDQAGIPGASQGVAGTVRRRGPAKVSRWQRSTASRQDPARRGLARDPVPALGGLRPDLPAAFSRLVDRCLLVDPAARFSSAVELVAALEALPSSELPAHGRPARRMGRWAAAFGAIALALLALWFQRGLLPMGERRLAVMAINRGSAGDAWIAPAIERMAAQRLRDRERRFRVSEGAAAANVLATLSYRRGDKGISLEADVGPKGGRSHRVVATDAASFSDAVNAILEALGDAIGEGQGELGPDPAERGEMARLGTASYEAYRRYRQSLDWYNGARIRDEVETRRRFEQVAGIDPGWAHAHVLLVHASGGARQAALARARASTDPARDPLGQRLLEADELRDQGRYAEAARIAEEVVRAAPDDLAARWSLFENHVGGHENEEAVADLRRLHERRPEQAYGTYLVMLLRLFGRDEQAEELSREWIARAPETQPALVEQADAALSARRPVEALQRARDLFAVYGEDRILRAHLCDRLLRVGYPREARELAEPLLGADELYRGRAHVLLGQIAVLEGRFPAAVESLQAAIALDLPGRVINAYEAGDVYNLLSILSRVLNRPDDAERYKTEEAKIYERWGIRPDMALAQFELELLHAGRLGCPDPEHAMASVTDERQSAPLRQALLGSAAEAGCASCKDLLGAGRPTMEWRQRLLYQFGVCAEAEAELDLARSVYETRILKTRILTPRYFPYDQVLAHFHLARVLERMGLASEASTRYREFLSFWADPSQPIVEVDQARTALQRLEPGGGTP